MTGVRETGSRPDTADAREFVRARMSELGIAISESDIETLAGGWVGLQPFLKRIREAPESGFSIANWAARSDD